MKRKITAILPRGKPLQLPDKYTAKEFKDVFLCSLFSLFNTYMEIGRHYCATHTVHLRVQVNNLESSLRGSLVLAYCG